MKNYMKMSFQRISVGKCNGLIFTFFLVLIFTACKKNKDVERSGYDPKLSIQTESVYPDSGGMLDQVILTGSNFGNDPKAIKVYFNQKRAIVRGAVGNKLLVLAPRLPGDNCAISVVIGKDSVVFSKKFRYIKNYVLNYIAGQQGGIQGSFDEGALTSTFFNGGLTFLAMDPINNLLFTQMRGEGYQGVIAYINEEKAFSKFLFIAENQNTAGSTMGPVFEPTQNKMVVPGHNNGYFWEVDVTNSFSIVKRQVLRLSQDQFSPEQIAAGYKAIPSNIQYIYSYGYSSHDGFLYSRTYGGMVYKFKLSDRVGSLVTGLAPTGASDNYVAFDPYDPTKLYCSLFNQHKISVIDITKAPTDPAFETVVAGTGGVGAFQDGHISIARFNQPNQFVITKDQDTGDKVMYICDSGNNCIRKLNLVTNQVTTVAGIPNKPGYSTGPPTKSQLSYPMGITANADGDLYIADRANRVVFKLAFQ